MAAPHGLHRSTVAAVALRSSNPAVIARVDETTTGMHFPAAAEHDDRLAVAV
jgi:hypothetical protein